MSTLSENSYLVWDIFANCKKKKKEKITEHGIFVVETKGMDLKYQKGKAGIGAEMTKYLSSSYVAVITDAPKELYLCMIFQ